HERGRRQRAQPAPVLHLRVALVAAVRDGRGRFALALGAVRDAHDPAWLLGRRGAQPPPAGRAARGHVRRAESVPRLVLAGGALLRPDGPVRDRRALLLRAITEG